MPFDWRRVPEDLEWRFADVPRGRGAWEMLVSGLANDGGEAGLSLLLDAFLERITNEDAAFPSAGPVLFVSHQFADSGLAERVAFLACCAGLDYWLDIHDPVLRLANSTLLPSDPRYSLAIAGIIEMALLNASHVVAVHTPASAGSRWVPYEFGRARDRRVRARNAGGWLHPTTTADAHGDYIRLARQAYGGETDVTAWLAQWSGGAPALQWLMGPPPPRLP